MERMLAGPAAALLFLAAAWAPASACEISPDYVRPSSFELVQISDFIVVATAREERKGDYDSPVVAFDVGEKVKGEAPPEVKVVGRLEPPAPDEHSGTSGPSVISVGGWCEPPPYRKGGRYLLFLQKGRDGQLRRNNHTLSPISEEYAGEDAAWMRRVRRYVRLQATAAPMDQIAILDRLADSRRGLAGEPLTAEEVRDIRDHLRSLSPFKPTAYLLAAYAALEQGRMPAHGVRRRGRDLAEMRRRVLSHLAKGDHPAAMPLFERLAAERPEDPDRIGLALRFFAKNGAYGRAFQWVETRLMKRLPQLAPAAARRLIGHVEQMQRGEEGEEPWRGDARAAALWPELALSLYWYQVRRFGPGDAVGFDDALRTLPHDDYRARPLLTLALAADYDQDITEWAMTELGDEAKRKAWEDLPDETRRKRADPAALPIRVLLSSWSQDRVTMLEWVFCQSEARRRLLIGAIGEAKGIVYARLIMKLAASALTGKERALLLDSTAHYADRNREDLEASIHSDIEADIRRGRRLGTPIACGNWVG